LPNETPKTFSAFSRMKNANSKKWENLNNNFENYVKNIEENDIIKLVKSADISNREKLARYLLDSVGLKNIPVKIESTNNYGYCQLENIYSSDKITISKYVLKKGDPRSYEYQIKTVFHELYHAKSNGLKHDLNKIGGLNNWAFIDDTAAECSAHYLTKQAGIDYEIMPSYAEYLVNNLPKLKKLDEFKNCDTIADFGKEFIKYRFSNEYKTAELNKLYQHCKNTNINLSDYANQYKQYIEDNIDDIVNKIAENIANSNNSIKSIIKQSVIDDWKYNNVKGRGFIDSLIVAMNRKGVK
jgi:hypothetical protein